MTKKKLTPAQKAWETMHERYTDEEISDRAREAAYKAWETRRSRGEAAKTVSKGSSAPRRISKKG